MSENVRLLKIQALHWQILLVLACTLSDFRAPYTNTKYTYVVSRHLSIALTYRAQFRHMQVPIQWNASFVNLFYTVNGPGFAARCDVITFYTHFSF